MGPAGPMGGPNFYQGGRQAGGPFPGGPGGPYPMVSHGLSAFFSCSVKVNQRFSKSG